jgi:hypothetical protein
MPEYCGQISIAMKSSWSLAAVFFLFTAATSYAAGPGDFVLVKQNKVISLYERWIDHGNEQVREIKAVFAVRSGIDAITKLLADQQKGTQWNVSAKDYRVLPLTTPKNWVSYIRYSIPWPFDDQDCCLLYTLNRNSSKAELNFESVTHEKFPVYKKITRMNGIKGKWMLEENVKGTTQVTYFISTDRSANVPRWVSDPIIRNNLFETITAFKNILEQ